MMKRFFGLAMLLTLASFSVAAAVWDGSAVSGSGSDFPDDGFYGACNSFPHNTSVTVTNLENGKSTTVIITKNADNPGVFIALSPKASAALGMSAGTATRIRAVALTASQADTSLPPARTDQSSDPDYNPKVFVDRAKAAEASPSGSASTAAFVTSPSAASAAAPESSTDVAASAGTAAAAAATVPDNSSPAKAAPAPSSANTEAVSKVEAPILDSTEAPPSTAPTARSSQIAQAPELFSADAPLPNKPQSIRLVAPDPVIPASVAASAQPAAASAQPAAAAEPAISPDTLPEEVISRITAPLAVEPTPQLAEAAPPATGSQSGTAPETIALDKPSYQQSSASSSLAEANPPVTASSAPLVVDDHQASPPESNTAKVVEPTVPKPESADSDRLASNNTTAPASGLEEPKTKATVSLVPAAPQPPVSPAPVAQAEPPVAAENPPPATPVAAATAPVTPAPSPVQPAPPVATPTPAVQPASAAKVAEAPVAPASVPVIETLDKGSFYIQVGVYGTTETLKSVVSSFKGQYPLAVQSVSTKKGSAFRLFIGPLGRDESGSMLLRMRYLGFKDAYLRKG